MKLTDNTPERGAGPFLFECPALEPGEEWSLPLRTLEVDGEKRALQKYVPFDTAGVTNGSNNVRVRATFNGQYQASILPNSVEVFDRQGVAEVRIRNTSDTETIGAGEVEVELTREPYGADDRALEQSQRGPVSNVIEKFTGLTVGGGL
jgi:hypothetical protein